MKEIHLTRGKVTLVDDEDYVHLSEHKWTYLESHKGYGGYAYRVTKDPVSGRKRAVLMHRHIINAGETTQVDHINRNTLDNRKRNLRLASAQENTRNKKVRNKYSRFSGVTKERGNRKWKAQIKPRKGLSLYLGRHESEIEAAIAYDLAAIKYFGEFANTNFKTINEYINATS